MTNSATQPAPRPFVPFGGRPHYLQNPSFFQRIGREVNAFGHRISSWHTSNREEIRNWGIVCTILFIAAAALNFFRMLGTGATFKGFIIATTTTGLCFTITFIAASLLWRIWHNHNLTLGQAALRVAAICFIAAAALNAIPLIMGATTVSLSAFLIATSSTAGTVFTIFMLNKALAQMPITQTTVVMY